MCILLPSTLLDIVVVFASLSLSSIRGGAKEGDGEVCVSGKLKIWKRLTNVL